MLFRARFASLLLPLLAPGAALRAQPEPGSAPSAPSHIALDVVVTPKSGAPVAGLQQSDFTILDNKVPRTITSFRAISGADDSTQVILVVDAVNTNFRSVAYERSQIDKFLRADEGRLAYATSLAIFTDTGMQVQETASTDGNQLSASLDQSDIGLREIRRSSGIAGADDEVSLSINAMQSLIAREARLPGRKIVLWISPGWPYLSGPNQTPDNRTQQKIFAEIVFLSTQLRNAGITLYSIDPLNADENIGHEFLYQEFLKGMLKPQQTDLGDLALQVLAIQSGGLAFSATNDIAGQLQRCIANSAAYYELSFDPPPAEHRDEYHQLEIKVDKPGLTARARTGYYNQP